MALPVALIGLIPELINKGIEIFDRKFTSESEREQARQEAVKDVQKRIESVWDKEQAHITERHKNDMVSDSWLSKNIRPLTLVYLMILFSMAFIYEVDDTVLQMLKELLMTTFIFYFGARGLEKIVKVAKG